MNNLKNLSDEEFITSFQRVVREERRITLEVIQHFEDAERRKIYAKLGFKSLFEWAVKEMKYSEGAAMRRINAMRIVRDVPETKQKILEGKVNLTTVSRVAQVRKTQTIEETKELLLRIEGMSTREVERVIEKKDPDVMRLELFVPREVYEKLKALQIQEGEMSLEGLLAKLAGKAEVKKSPSAPAVKVANPDSRYVPKAVKREILKRDGARCTYVGEKGRRCEATCVQNDHIVPFMLGGPTEIENLRLLCPTHNRFEAERIYGREKIERETR